MKSVRVDFRFPSSCNAGSTAFSPQLLPVLQGVFKNNILLFLFTIYSSHYLSLVLQLLQISPSQMYNQFYFESYGCIWKVEEQFGCSFHDVAEQMEQVTMVSNVSFMNGSLKLGQCSLINNLQE